MTGAQTPEVRSEEERRRGGGRSAPPDAWGIVPAYEDAFGAWTEVPTATRDALVRAMGGDPSASAPPEVDDVVVVRSGDRTPLAGATRIRFEDGTGRELDGELPDDLPLGYHDAEVAGRRDTVRVIVSPGRCQLPDADAGWGWALQLYALRSATSWGIGDLADLRRFASWSRQVGAGVVLVNPLNAVTPVSPRETSPYYPTSRRYLDPLMLAIEEVPGFEELDGHGELRSGGRALTDDAPIDRDRVVAAKLTTLERIWDEVEGVRTDPALVAFEVEGGRDLELFATFCVLAERHGGGWRSWPEALHHPDARAVAEVADAHRDRVRFHVWLQLLSDAQLARAGAELPLLGDLPIGADPDGADAWAWQDVLADGVSVGAPPDELGPQGQNWTLPAFVPWKLRAARYEPFIATLRAALRHVGGLRIDHVLGLFRLFWIPPGGTAADGAYVQMPSRELLDIVALESVRAGAFVVGEDLGTVGEGVREELDARDLLRYQVFWFEQDPVEDWTPKALASVSTHDLPTVAGVWTGDDAAMQAELGQEPDDDWHAELRARISGATGLPEDAPVADVVVALHAHVAAGPNRVVLAQLDDALGVTDRPNVPGTDRHARPANWSLPLPVRVEGLAAHPTAAAVAAAMTAARAARP
ncbi:MAG: 4-alpha-glucanotransferase [Nitriliruptor sp.]|uniref:4-alpha-glucanotransferase n=1 Tax=Nitriliruptor sp. TaxID=2448056 RepID=UPI00349FF22D